MARLLLNMYTVLGHVLTPVSGLLIRVRAKRGKEILARRGERFGRASIARPKGRLVWVHAASVGETAAALVLVDALRECRPDVHMLLTSGTVTSARFAAQQGPKHLIHQFAPLDMPLFVKRFIRHWRPEMAIFIESELWPVILTQLDRHSVPRLLLNARMSERSLRNWQRFPALGHDLLRGFSACLAQSDEDAQRLKALGATQTTVSGNLKSEAPPLPADETALAALKHGCAGRPLIIAASTHDGEEQIMAEIHQRLEIEMPGLLTIIIPRHPVRGAAIAEMLNARGFRTNRRDASVGVPPATCQLYIADTLGELGLFFRLGSIVVMGGSFSRHGGHNPLEPLRLGAFVLHGPNIENFNAIYRELDQAGATKMASNTDMLEQLLKELLQKPRLLKAGNRPGREALQALAGAREASMRAALRALEGDKRN